MSICLKNQKIIGDLKWRRNKISDANLKKKGGKFLVKNNNVGKYIFRGGNYTAVRLRRFPTSFLFFKK